MSYQVTVCPFYSEQSFLQFDPPISEQTKELRWEERMRAALDVEEEETLDAVMQRAKLEFDLKPRILRALGVFEDMPAKSAAELPHFFRFYEADHDPPLEQTESSLFARDLVGVDREGCAHWNRQSTEIPKGDLVRAGDAGLLDGDPLRPYLVLSIPQGSSGLIEAWTVLQTVWTVMGGLSSTSQLMKLTAQQAARVRHLLRGKAVVEEHSEQWMARGGGPHQVRMMIERQPWAPEDLKALLGLEDTEDAIAVLELFGCTADSNGKYSLDDETESKLIRLAEDDAFSLLRMGFGRHRVMREDMVSDRVKTLLETGERSKERPSDEA